MPRFGEPNGKGRRQAETAVRAGGSAAGVGLLGYAAGREGLRQSRLPAAQRSLRAIPGRRLKQGAGGLAALVAANSLALRARPAHRRGGPSLIDWTGQRQQQTETARHQRSGLTVGEAEAFGSRNWLKPAGPKRANPETKRRERVMTSSQQRLAEPRPFRSRLTAHIPERRQKPPKGGPTKVDRSGWVMDDRVPGLVDRGWRT